MKQGLTALLISLLVFTAPVSAQEWLEAPGRVLAEEIEAAAAAGMPEAMSGPWATRQRSDASQPNATS